jgi:hypothetical protein
VGDLSGGPGGSDTIILLRAHRMNAQAMALAQRLTSQTPYRVALVADESRAPVECGALPKVSITAESCRALGLHWRRDAGWRCGDYGFYHAQRQLPAARHIWMIEYDVALRFEHLARFFEIYADEPADVLLCQLREAGPDWYWYHAMRMKRATVYRCLFPILRLSAVAVVKLMSARQTYGASAALRLEWPNDEAFVATEAMALGLACRDLNDCGQTVYSDASMSFHCPIDGDELERRAFDSMIYHPVLYGDALAAKRARLEAEAGPDSLRARVTRRMMRLAWT